MICQGCSTSLQEEVNFCPNCGSSVKADKKMEGSNPINLIILFYVVDLVFLVSIYFVYASGTSLLKEIVIESISAMLVLGFVSLDFKNIIKLYRFPTINPTIFLGVLLAPFITGIAVYYGIEYVNAEIFYENYNSYTDYVSYPNSMLWAILFIAILPPIFEELAYRGFLFNQLQKITSVKVTIILTSFIFALVHFSVISLLWIFPFGLLLGYLRHRYNTLWLGMIVHFIHNLIVLYLDYYYYNSTLSEFSNLL